ncbi:sigma-54 interaction domain-containing protein [Thiobacter aerophilum]|uniref:Sigma 54-interacting transcriptional regulator n=1 Tax=Thiobacter aerophilum TaxID=3121275 RepID=A0ABV0EB51_9BURK
MLDIQGLIDLQDDPFVLIDRDYRIVAANSAYCQAYGVAREDVVGRRCHEVSHHSRVPCHENGEDCPHVRVFSGQTRVDLVHVHFDALGRPEHVKLVGRRLASVDGRTYLGEQIRRLAGTELDCDELRMIGRSPAFLACVEHLTAAAQAEAPVLLLGESGVGKELAAQYIHRRSERAAKPFVALDCAAIPESLFEAELFGHERGAFTGCVGRREGLFEQADGGTLFLDEIGEIPLSMQAKLLRVLETGEFRRVGGREIIRADVRLVSATNRDLLAMVDEGRFRQDLYYRIAGIDVRLPPLRERRSDIPALAEVLLGRLGTRDGRRYRFSDEALALLVQYDYPGNVRELRNIVQKAAALAPNGLIGPEHILFPHERDRRSVPEAPAPVPDRPPRMVELEARHIAEMLTRHQGNRRRVAQALGISERTLYRKLARYQLR